MKHPFYISSGSSPHTRGAQVDGHRRTAARRIIPAYAGSTRPRASRINGTKDHPRIRGEHLVVGELVALQCGSSPHTRGALVPGHYEHQNCVDHPRIRGEHPAGAPTSTSAAGSSPHTRGAHLVLSFRAGDHGIIPAYAGSTLSMANTGLGVVDHPRIRGEHLRFRCVVLELMRIIPAYAGSTSSHGP